LKLPCYELALITPSIRTVTMRTTTVIYRKRRDLLLESMDYLLG